MALPNYTVQGVENFAAIEAPSYVDARVLAATTEETHTIPSNARYVIFSGTTAFYAAYDATAGVPAADVTDGTSAELIPIGQVTRFIQGKSTIHLISSGVCIVTMAFYR